MSQSEHEASKCGRRPARENADKEVTIGFGLFLIGWKICASFVNQWQRSYAKPKQTRTVFDTEVKTTPQQLLLEILIGSFRCLRLLETSNPNPALITLMKS